MKLPQTTTGAILDPSHSSSDRLPQVLTVQEAALLIGTTPEALWQRIRAAQIPFTLVSGRRDDGTSVLLHTEELVLAGILPDQPRERPPVQASPQSSRPLRLPANKGNDVTRLAGYGRLMIAVAVASMIVAAVVPSVRRSMASIVLTPVGLYRSTPTAAPSLAPNRRPAVASHSRGRSGRGPSTRPAGPAGSQARSHLPPQPVSRSPSPAPSGLVSPVAPPPPSDSGAYSVPSSILSDCSRDVTSDLLAWMNSVPNSSTLNFSTGGCYRIDGSLRIANRVGLVIDGYGATFDGSRNRDGQARHWWIQHSRDITLKNMTVKGANPHAGARDDAFVPKMQWQHGYAIWGSENVLLDHVQAYDVFGDLVDIEPMFVGRTPTNSRNVIVQNSHFERNGRMGIAITGAEDVTIRNNYIGEVRHALLDLEPEWKALPITNVRFTGNRTGKVWLLWIANGGSCNAGVSNIRIADNVMEETAGMPLLEVTAPSGCALRGPYTIERNKLIARSSPRAAFDLRKVRNAIVRNNSAYFIADRRTRVFVNLVRSTRVSVRGNTITSDKRNKKIVFVQADDQSDYVESGNRKL